MIDGFKFVAVGIEHERGIVARMIWALARGAIVPGAVRQRDPVEFIDHDPITRLESEVMPAGQGSLRRPAVRRRNEQLVRPEKSVARAADGDPEHIEDGLIKGRLAGRSRTTN